MILLLIKKALGDEHRKIYVLHARLLKSRIHLRLNEFPDSIACRLKYHASLNGCIVHEFRLLDHVRIPLGEILLHRCDRFY